MFPIMGIFCSNYMPKYKTKFHLNKNNGVKVSEKYLEQNYGNQSFTTQIKR